ncbi:biotin-dependent carboxyltransferase family protein [Polaribacter uvawellassae]|uniref:5-oxoprolinase subunit C family protein n=1 Tax=Polaribacter uvawellassae TaxID=3133495 RepID=UPI00321C13C3
MITVLNPGIYSTIQDLGRSGFAHIGVPVSGVMDSYAAKIGNQLLHNNLDEAVIEITFGGCKFLFEENLEICITGANFTPTIDGKEMQMNSVLEIEKGAVLSFGKKTFGIRTYLCIKGGISSEVVLKSKSFYKGITANFVLKKGDQFKINSITSENKRTLSKIKIDEEYFKANTIECCKGSEFELLPKQQQEKLLQGKYTISNDNNRVGYRLEESFENQLKPILTSGVLPGTVQLTPSGKIIVLMKDCQVTGGYPRVLQLTENALNILAQKSTKDKLQFRLK